MKKIVILVILVTAGYFGYTYLNSESYDTAAQKALKLAMRGQDICMATQREYCRSVGNCISGVDDWKPNPDLVFNILEADASNYIMEIYHVKGKNIYTGTLDEAYKPVITVREKGAEEQ
ncbi:MAG: hypothetical protein ACOZBW_10125 [Thermodesulfobacteriota bacterium]